MWLGGQFILRKTPDSGSRIGPGTGRKSSGDIPCRQVSGQQTRQRARRERQTLAQLGRRSREVDGGHSGTHRPWLPWSQLHGSKTPSSGLSPDGPLAWSEELRTGQG